MVISSDGSYERRERRTRVLGCVLYLAFYAVMFAMARATSGSVMAFLMCTPILAAFVAWWLVQNATGASHLLRWLALRRVNGSYHAFDDIAVRIVWNEDRCWIAAQDVFAVLRKPFDPKTSHRLEAWCDQGGFVRDEQGQWWFEGAVLLRWLQQRRTRMDRRANRFRLWLEREALPAMHRKQERRL